MTHCRLPPIPSFAIYWKTFSLEISHGISITESLRDKSFTLSLKKDSLSWLNPTFSTLIEAPMNQKLFIKSRLDEYDLWVEKVSNRKGHFAEII